MAVPSPAEAVTYSLIPDAITSLLSITNSKARTNQCIGAHFTSYVRFGVNILEGSVATCEGIMSKLVNPFSKSWEHIFCREQGRT